MDNVNILDFIYWLENTANKYNTDKLCDRCWKFLHAKKPYLNLTALKDDDICCWIIMLIDFNIKSIYNYGENELSNNIQHSIISIELFIGTNSELDIQYHNEIPNKDPQHSKYKLYIEPIIQCIYNNIAIDICENNNLEIMSINCAPEINFLDANYDGIVVTMTLKQT